MTQPTVSKHWKEVVVLRIGFNPTRSTSPCYKLYRCMQYIHKNESKHSEMGPVRQNQSRELLRLFTCVCIALCTIVAHNIAQNRPDNFPSYPLDNHHCSDDVCYLRARGTVKVISFPLKSGWFLKQPVVVLHGNFNFMQRISTNC